MNSNEFYKNLFTQQDTELRRRMLQESVDKPTVLEFNLYRLQQERMKILINLIADLLDGDESKKEELKKFILIDTNLHEMIDE